MTEPLPLCETCGVNRVTRMFRTTGVRTRFSPRCVPGSIKAEGARKGRKNSAHRLRAKLFRSDVQRIVTGERLTHEDLMALLMTVYRRGYNTGFKTGQKQEAA
jgi:hypothetical protein